MVFHIMMLLVWCGDVVGIVVCMYMGGVVTMLDIPREGNTVF